MMEPMRSLAPLLAVLAVAGCVNPAEHLPTKEEPVAQPAAPAAAPSGGVSVQIHGMGAGAAAPVTGSESVMGSGGGGVGQAAKEQARKAAATGGGSSLDQLGQEGGN